jgi:hypothetical protein
MACGRFGFRLLSLAVRRVATTLRVTLQFVRQSFAKLTQAGGVTGRPANPVSGKVKLIGFPLSKAWIARPHGWRPSEKALP